MTAYALFAYLNYRRKALGRHGVHSPLVYDFVERVIRNRSALPFRNKLEGYFGATNIVWINEADPAAWNDQYLRAMENGTSSRVVLFENIHQTANHTKIWHGLHRRPEVWLSLDLHRYGLLIFREELREKQHFILLYRPSRK